MAEYGSGNSPMRNDPGRRLIVITPDDDNEITQTPRALYIGGTGNIAIIAIDDSEPVVFVNVPAGTVLPVSVSKVMDTSTTATFIVGIL